MEIKKYFKLVIYLLLPISVFLIYVNRWNIYDAYRLNGYNTPTEVTKLATDTSMTDYGSRLFYVNHPDLTEKDNFNEKCQGAEQTIILGCFIAFKGIYLHNITDERLEGIKQVTAAHEMLHAGYQRLEPSEKTRINKLLNEEFQKITNERIKKTIEEYRQNGADVNNELHSIIATEVATISQELEEYYKKYFTNRLQTVQFSEKYESAFTSRKQQVADFDKQLTDIKREIDSSNKNLDTKYQELNARQQSMQKLLADNRKEEYNAQVPVYNALVTSYNQQVNKVKALIDLYNSIVKKRNEIALEEGELVKAIDSRPDTINSR